LVNKEDQPQESAEDEEDLGSQVTKIFRDHGFDVLRGVVVGNTVSDFFVVSPTGTSSVFEVKYWEPNPNNVRWAERLASNYLSASGANNAFILMPQLASSDTDSGLVAIADLDNVLEHEPIFNQPSQASLKPEVKEKPKKKIFVAMPFDPQFEDTYFHGIQPACLAKQFESERVDRQAFTGDIVAQIKDCIRGSVAVLADISDSRPNVLYEMGIGEGLGLPIIQISSTGYKNLPFDVRNNKTIDYEIGRIHELRPRLEEELSGLLE